MIKANYKKKEISILIAEKKYSNSLSELSTCYNTLAMIRRYKIEQVQQSTYNIELIYIN